MEKGIYKHESLFDEGFIHCSEIDQIIPVANYNFKGQSDLVLLCIENDKVRSEIRYEDLYSSGVNYPHIYGPLNTNAVIDVIEFDCEQDGTFKLPEKAKKYL